MSTENQSWRIAPTTGTVLTSWVTLNGDADLRVTPTSEGLELSCDDVLDLVLTPEAAERLRGLIDANLPAVRELQAAES
ncbi:MULTISPECIES: hypothetical protein [Actinosynnema]|uniref:hypothetical protein n=1 Tax=Actinosynnema TaxID=40566 RepID=UPI0020A46503|nr:hypothetical protein [Actinosynnema pretiosum]MCP2099135.1 hypothetical protein [Actinosynnema pretiosum]